MDDQDRGISGFRLDEVGDGIPDLGNKRVVISGPFILGPVPFRPVVDHMPPGFRLLFAVWRQQGLDGGGWVKLHRRVWRLARLSTRSARKNALVQMEKLPFVSVNRPPGAFAYARIDLATGAAATARRPAA